MRLIDKLLIVAVLLARKERVLISGQVDTFIIGGEDAKYIPHPWMVSIYFGCFDKCEPDERCESMTCGGTLITQQWVLTAAHCFEVSFENLRYYQVYVGDYNFMADNDTNEVHMEVEKIIKHPNYIHSTTTVQNDVALVKLKHPVNKTAETKCLKLADNKDDLRVDCHLFGWGEAAQGGDTCTKSETLKSVDLNRVDLETCRQYYSNHTLYDKNVCAGGIEHQGACYGDSGGGLYCPNKTEDVYELLGIASWTFTKPCASFHKPTVFTDASAFHDWIDDNCEHCLKYNKNNCRNPVHMKPVIPTTTTVAPSCSYPADPSNGHYTCSNSDSGGRVSVGEVCTLHCYNDHDGGSMTCQQNGYYNMDDLTKDNCGISTSYCPYPDDPQNGHYQCPAKDGSVNSGQVCVFRCYDGQFGGTMQCRPNGSYDQSQLVECGTSRQQCHYPLDLLTGHFLCPSSSVGGMVDKDDVCVLRCYNGQFGNYMTCKWNGQYEVSHLEEYKCDGVVTIKTTTPTPAPTTSGQTTSSVAGCAYPSPPPGANYNCPGFTPGSLVDIGTTCYLICAGGQFAGSITCMDNGQYDESNLDENKCKPSTTTVEPDEPTTEPSTTEPSTVAPGEGCPFPSPPPNASYNCPGIEPGSLVGFGKECFLVCGDGTWAGSSICMENGQFDESNLEKWKCYPTTDCQIEDRDYYGNDIEHFYNIDTWMECGVLCKDEDKCTHWTLDTRRKCWIKEGYFGDGFHKEDYISGDRNCP